MRAEQSTSCCATCFVSACYHVIDPVYLFYSKYVFIPTGYEMEKVNEVYIRVGFQQDGPTRLLLQMPTSFSAPYMLDEHCIVRRFWSAIAIHPRDGICSFSLQEFVKLNGQDNHLACIPSIEPHSPGNPTLPQTSFTSFISLPVGMKTYFTSKEIFEVRFWP